MLFRLFSEIHIFKHAGTVTTIVILLCRIEVEGCRDNCAKILIVNYNLVAGTIKYWSNEPSPLLFAVCTEILGSYSIAIVSSVKLSMIFLQQILSISLIFIVRVLSSLLTA